MQIDRFRHEDVDAFLTLAEAEGWICDRWEFDFLLSSFPQGCLAVRNAGAPVAFITSVRYGKSGWIGNLIVRRDLRGAGIGNTLMRNVLTALVDAGARTVWLTASEAGISIYGRLGFVAVDTIKRWCGTGTGRDDAGRDVCSPADVLAIDRAGWGDLREPLITEVVRRGRVALGNDAFLISQPSDDGLQLGPWGAAGREMAARLLDEALARVGKGTRIWLDAPVRNVDAAVILHGRGFTVRGSAALMYLGEKPAYDPARIYALASMGSMG